MTNRGSLDLALVMAKGSLPRTTTCLRTVSPGLTNPMNRGPGLTDIDGVTGESSVPLLVADPAHIEAAEALAERLGELPVVLLEEKNTGGVRCDSAIDLSDA